MGERAIAPLARLRDDAAIEANRSEGTIERQKGLRYNRENSKIEPNPLPRLKL